MTITNPTPVRSKVYKIHPFSNQYCQLRLDFETFTLGQPSTQEGVCSASERVVFTGQSGPPKVPTLCGNIEGHSTEVITDFMKIYLFHF